MKGVIQLKFDCFVLGHMPSVFFRTNYGRQSSSRVGKGSNRVEINRNVQKYTKKSLAIMLVLLATVLISKVITEIIKKTSEFSRCANSCNKFISIRYWWTVNVPKIFSWKRTSSPVALIWKGKVEMSPPFTRSPMSLGPTMFDFRSSIFNCFHNKILSAQGNTHSIHILFTVPQITAFLEWNYYLCVVNIMRVLPPFLLDIKSWCRSTLHEIHLRCCIYHKTFFNWNQIETLR